MVSLSGTLSRLEPIRVLILGDLMLDRYTKGTVSRSSPEAPVVVLRAQEELNRAGGAGNVALNLASLGAQVTILGRIGNDTGGRRLRKSLEKEGINTAELVTEPNYPTPVKNRMIAGGQQLLRVDHEELSTLSEQLEQHLIERLPDLFDEVDIVAISDYAKGFLTEAVLKEAISGAWSRGIKVLVDPKGSDFAKYSGVSVIKPNLKEARLAAGLDENAPLGTVAKAVLKQSKAEYLLLTRSEGGISVFDQRGNRGDFPARVREVTDVTGAGDTVLATITCAMGNGLSIADAAQLANVAAGIAIEKVGCVPVTVPELAARLLDLDVVHKVFHEDHLHALTAALGGRKFAIVGMHSEDGLTAETFMMLRKLTRGGKRQVVVYVRDDEPDDAYIHLLESLQDVSYIILKSRSLLSFAETIRAHEVYSIENGRLHKQEGSEALLAEQETTV